MPRISTLLVLFVVCGCADGTSMLGDMTVDAEPVDPDGATPLGDGAMIPPDGGPVDENMDPIDDDIAADADTDAAPPGETDGSMSDADGSMGGPDASMEDVDAGVEPPWDGMGPFPGPCRLDITGDGTDRRLRWVYDDDLRIILERIDEGLDGSFEREFAFSWSDGPARVPCAASGPPLMRTPHADMALADPLPSEGAALRGGCGPDGLRTLSDTHRLVEQEARVFDGPNTHRITRTYTWDDAGRIASVDQRFNESLQPAFAPQNPHRYMDADYDGQGLLTRMRVRRTVVSTIDAEDAIGFVETRRTYGARAVQVSESRDYAEGSLRQSESYADGRLVSVTTGDVVRTLRADADGRPLGVDTRREGAPVGHHAIDYTLDGTGRVVEVIASMGATADLAMPMRRATLVWGARGNLLRRTDFVRRDGAWVESRQWAYGYGCW